MYTDSEDYMNDTTTPFPLSEKLRVLNQHGFSASIVDGKIVYAWEYMSIENAESMTRYQLLSEIGY